MRICRQGWRRGRWRLLLIRLRFQRSGSSSWTTTRPCGERCAGSSNAWGTKALHERLPGLPIVLISGHLDRALQDDPQSRHLAAILAKPFGRSELELAIRSVLARN